MMNRPLKKLGSSIPIVIQPAVLPIPTKARPPAGPLGAEGHEVLRNVVDMFNRHFLYQFIVTHGAETLITGRVEFYRNYQNGVQEAQGSWAAMVQDPYQEISRLIGQKRMEGCNAVAWRSLPNLNGGHIRFRCVFLAIEQIRPLV